MEYQILWRTFGNQIESEAWKRRCLRRHLQITFHWAAEVGQEGRTCVSSSAKEEKGKTSTCLSSVQHLQQHGSQRMPLSFQVYSDSLSVYAVLAPLSFWLSSSFAFILHADVWKVFILVIQKELFCTKSSWLLILVSPWGKKKRASVQHLGPLNFSGIVASSGQKQQMQKSYYEKVFRVGDQGCHSS